MKVNVPCAIGFLSTGIIARKKYPRALTVPPSVPRALNALSVLLALKKGTIAKNSANRLSEMKLKAIIKSVRLIKLVAPSKTVVRPRSLKKLLKKR